MAESHNSSLPNQLAPDSVKKGKTWQKETTDKIITDCLHSVGRKSNEEIYELEQIANGKLSKTSLKKAINPMNLEDFSDTDSLFEGDRNYSVLNGVIDSLIGEEIRRPFDAKCLVLNPEAITRKEEGIKEAIQKELQAMILNGIKDDRVAQDKLASLAKWSKYEAQDSVERLGNQIMNYLKKELDIRFLFKEGIKSKIYTGSEIYYVGNNGFEPYLKNVEVSNLYFNGMGEKQNIEDADKIVEVFWLSIGDTIAQYGKFLSKAEVNTIIGNSQEIANQKKNMYELVEFDTEYSYDWDNEKNPLNFKNFDQYGNVKIYRVVFKTYRYINEIEYIDELGNAQTKFIHSSYKPNVELGESLVAKIPVPEYWESIRIGEDIYPYCKPLEIQMRSLDNPAICKSPYIGLINKECILDDLVPLAIDYVIYAKKLKELWVSNIGNVAVIDISRIPRGSEWNLEKWLLWARKFRFIIEDSFQADEKGNVAGHMQQNNRSINMSAGQEITQIINYLEYIENLIEKRSGVSRQRQGDIKASDGLGTTQQAIMQSSLQTEELFYEHDFVKLKVMERLLAVTQFIWKGKNIKKQFVLDDLTMATLEVIGDEFYEDQLGVAMTDGSKAANIESFVTDLSHAALQSGMISFSDAIKIKLAPSPSSMIALMKQSEEETQARQQDMQRMESENRQKELQMMQEYEFKKMQTQHMFNMEEIKLKLQLEALKLEQSEYARLREYEDDNKNGIEDQVELDMANMQDKTKKYEIDTKARLEQEKIKLEKHKIEVSSKEAEKDRANALKIASKRKTTNK